MLDTNQYSVTDMNRMTEHGQGVPGSYLAQSAVVFKADFEDYQQAFFSSTISNQCT
jgi:hypothetical protein